MEENSSSGLESKSDPQKRSKVERLISEYDLNDISKELEHQWLGIDRERLSLRDLAESFNVRLLKAALRQAGEQPIDGEAENHYRLLTSDDVTKSSRTQAETRLARKGINVEKVKQDFVSHQAIHKYLTEVRGVRLPSDGASTSDTTTSNRLETILRLRNRLGAVTEQSLDSLQQAGHLSIGEFDVMVNLTMYCKECGISMDITDLFDEGGCDCRHENQ